jgi:hypothetical protein
MSLLMAARSVMRVFGVRHSEMVSSIAPVLCIRDRSQCAAEPLILHAHAACNAVVPYELVRQ